jgi:hypothetical protein
MSGYMRRRAPHFHVVAATQGRHARTLIVSIFVIARRPAHTVIIIARRRAQQPSRRRASLFTPHHAHTQAANCFLLAPSVNARVLYHTQAAHAVVVVPC